MSQVKTHYSDNNARPTFRAKGVIKDIIELENDKGELTNFRAADVEIGGFTYSFPICRNARIGDVLVVKLDVINLKNRGDE
jgi:hypothetical protein